jgi:hypothetical protein
VRLTPRRPFTPVVSDAADATGSCNLNLQSVQGVGYLFLRQIGLAPAVGTASLMKRYRVGPQGHTPLKWCREAPGGLGRPGASSCSVFLRSQEGA